MSFTHHQLTQRGFVLIPVVMLISLIAVLAFTLNHEGPMGLETAEGQMEAIRVEQVVRAGLAHAEWWVNTNSCLGDQTITTVPLGSAGTGNYTSTIESAATTVSTTLIADRDVWIMEAAPDTNFGTDVQQGVKNTTGDGFRSLYHYDLSAIAPGTRVAAATAWFYVMLGDTAAPVMVHAVSDAWTEGGATWNTVASSFNPDVYAMIAPQSANGVWVSVNLTALAQRWVSDPSTNHGIMLVPASNGVESRYSSREYSAGERPYLQITTSDTDVSPVAISVTGTLASGVTRDLTVSPVRAYQPPTTTFLQPGPTDGKDVRMSGANPTSNYGADDVLDVQENNQQRSLIEFDLVPLPVGAYVTSASLRLYTTQVQNPGAVRLYRVERPWVEGTCQGSGCTPDGASWNTYDGADPWSHPGADLDSAPVAGQTVTDQNTWYTWDITPVARQWVQGTQANYGLAIIGDPSVSLGFASSDHAAAAWHPQLVIELACECGRPCLTLQGAGKVLMVVGDKTSPHPQDLYKRALLESWGYAVALIDDDNAQSTFDSEVNSHDVVYVSESIDPASLGTKLVNAPIGVVNEDGWINDELGIESGNSSNWQVGNRITVTDNTHYITELFAAGTLRIYDADMGGVAVATTPAPDMQALADWGTSTGLAVLETGAMSAGGLPVAARRVMLPFGRAINMDWSRVNSNGRLILQRALQWGMGTAVPASCDADYLPTIRVGSFEYPSGTQFEAMRGVTFVPEGFQLDGASAPTGGAWVAVDWGTWSFRMYDVSGAVLSETLATPSGNLNGLTLVGGGSFAGYLATVRSSLTSDELYYVDPKGVVPAVMIDIQGVSTDPSGVAYIGGSASSTYDDHLAITDEGANRIYIISQSGSLVHTIDLSGVAGSLSGIVHLAGTDTFLVVDQGTDLVRVVDFAGNVLSSYDLSSFNLPNAQAIAVNPDTCDHVIANDGGLSGADFDEMAYLNTTRGSGCAGTFRDEFNVLDYTGNNGTLSWASDWQEVNESDGPIKGDEQVANDSSAIPAGPTSQLRVRDSDGGGEGVMREFDLSGATYATLSLSYRRESLDNSADYVAVEMSGNGSAGPWTEIARFQGPVTESAYQPFSLDISPYISSNSTIRFVSSPDLGNTDAVWFDNVQIECAP